MKTININGREIKTNYGGNYPLYNGNSGNTMVCEDMQWVLEDGCKYKSLEGEEKMFQRLVDCGYSRITFYRVTTRIRGMYHIIALCK